MRPSVRTIPFASSEASAWSSALERFSVASPNGRAGLVEDLNNYEMGAATSATCLDDRGRDGVGELHGDPVAGAPGGREGAHRGADHDLLSPAIRRLEGGDARGRVVGQELDHHVGGGAVDARGLA